MNITPDTDQLVSFEAHKTHFMLHMDLATTADVIRWADGMISKLDAPPAEIIAISEATGESEVDLRHRLEPLMKHAKMLEPLRPAFGVLAANVAAGRIQAHDVVGKLAEYGVTDSTGSQLMPDDFMQWVNVLFYECVNLRYIYPDRLLLHQGVGDFCHDVFAGCKSIAETGTYHYRIRPAVEQARKARDATAVPVAHEQQSGGPMKRLLSWFHGGRQT